MTRPFPFGEYWAIRTNAGLCVFVSDEEAYEAWSAAQNGLEGGERT